MYDSVRMVTDYGTDVLAAGILGSCLTLFSVRPDRLRLVGGLRAMERPSLLAVGPACLLGKAEYVVLDRGKPAAPRRTMWRIPTYWEGSDRETGLWGTETLSGGLTYFPPHTLTGCDVRLDFTGAEAVAADRENTAPRPRTAQPLSPDWGHFLHNRRSEALLHGPTYETTT
jgi:hypothetical protein